jgi:hypothetical protein
MSSHSVITNHIANHNIKTSTSTSASSSASVLNAKLHTFKLNSSIAEDLLDIYSDPICSSLLKNDCILFGDFVINFFAKRKLNFAKIIYAYACISLKHIIERDLYGKLYTKSSTIESSFGYSECRYKCIYKQNLYNVVILYVNYIKKIDGSIIKTHSLFNIDTLSISRREIKILTWFDEHNNIYDEDVPVPFHNIMDDIHKCKFSIIYKIDTVNKLNRVLTFIKHGWMNKSSTLLYDKAKVYTDLLCEICHETVTKPDIVVSLKCTHFFHSDCWYENIKQHITNTSTDLINCPTCRKSYYIHEVI